MKRSQSEESQIRWFDTENERRPEGKTWYNLPWVMFSFNWLVISWRGKRVRLKLDVQGRAGG